MPDERQDVPDWQLDERRAAERLRDRRTQDLEVHYAQLIERVRQLEESAKEIKNEYVRKDAFGPVRNAVYGILGLVASALVAAFFANFGWVIHK